MEPKISVIVPVYKVEKYLEKCVKSLVNQSYKNLEIILVDDGSPDNCPALCDSYAKQDNRIKVIHQENMGLSAARNAGIDIASGEYIGFVDSDDYIHKNMYEVLMKTCLDNHCDIAVCSLKKFEKEIEADEVITEPGLELYEKEKKFEAYFKLHGTEMIVAWNKLYKKELFHNVRYPKGKIHEDEFTTYILIGAAERVAFVNFPFYYYFQRAESIMGQGFSLKSLDRLEAFKLRQQYFKSLGNEYIYQLGLYNMQYWIMLYFTFAGNNMEYRKLVLEYETWCWENLEKELVKEYFFKALYSGLKQKRIDKALINDMFRTSEMKEIINSSIAPKASITTPEYWFRSGRKMKYIIKVLAAIN